MPRDTKHGRAFSGRLKLGRWQGGEMLVRSGMRGEKVRALRQTKDFSRNILQEGKRGVKEVFCYLLAGQVIVKVTTAQKVHS